MTTSYLPIVIAASTVVFMLSIGGWMTTIGPWYRDLRKPAWNPPDWVFGPAWTLILALAGWSGVLAWSNASYSAEQIRILALFGINILLHMLWSPLFFNLRRPDWALIEIPFLWLSIVALMFGLATLSPASTWLLAPYLVWVTFAAFLNLTIVRMNGPFRARSADGAAPQRSVEQNLSQSAGRVQFAQPPIILSCRGLRVVSDHRGFSFFSSITAGKGCFEPGFLARLVAGAPVLLRARRQVFGTLVPVRSDQP